MIRLTVVFSAIIGSLLLWHECGEDISIFCYRIGWGTLASVRSRALVPLAAYSRNFVRMRRPCSNRSGIFSIPSTTSKG